MMAQTPKAKSSTPSLNKGCLMVAQSLLWAHPSRTILRMAHMQKPRATKLSQRTGIRGSETVVQIALMLRLHEAGITNERMHPDCRWWGFDLQSSSICNA